MGLSLSTQCDAVPLNPAFADVPKSAAAAEEYVDFANLPQPIKYEELQREAYMALKFESFEGFKFDITKPLNQNFYLSHRVMLGTAEVQSGQPGVVMKTPISEYNYGATVANEKMLLLGQIGSTGNLTSRMTWRVSDFLGLKLESRVVSEPGPTQVMGDIEFTGADWNGQLKLGNGGFYGCNYMQSITPTLSAGTEAFYLAKGGKSGVGAVLRHATPKHVSTVQVATTGILSCTYFHKVNEKAQVATDFLWNTNLNEATASVGYDYHFRACRLRGNINSDGKIAACLEERLAPHVTLVLSAELDHARKDHKFGFGMTVGE